jgi:hypothetical protein
MPEPCRVSGSCSLQTRFSGRREVGCPPEPFVDIRLAYFISLDDDESPPEGLRALTVGRRWQVVRQQLASVRCLSVGRCYCERLRMEEPDLFGVLVCDLDSSSARWYGCGCLQYCTVRV